jgi:hypothetical protein
MLLNEVVDDVLQGDSVERIAWVEGRIRHFSF